MDSIIISISTDDAKEILADEFRGRLGLDECKFSKVVAICETQVLISFHKMESDDDSA